MLLLMRAAELSEESHIHLARHVEAGEPSAEEQERPDEEVSVRERLPDDLALGKKSGERENPAQREGRSHEGPEGYRHFVTQAAHLAHVLLATHRVNHRATPEE